MRFQFDISNRAFFFSALAVSFIIILSLAIAYNSANPNPAIFGHSANEIEGFFNGNRYAIYTSSNTFTVPAGVTKVLVEMVGAGGGGGGGSQSLRGGGGGAYLKTEVAVTSGQAITIVVGTGGNGGNINQIDTNGGASSFGSLSVEGGKGGNAGGGKGGAMPLSGMVRSAGTTGLINGEGGNSVLGLNSGAGKIGGTGAGGVGGGYSEFGGKGGDGIVIVYW